MGRMKIRNPKVNKWRWWVLLAFLASCITVGMEFYLSDHALSPNQIQKEGQYCAATSQWMSEAFAVETLDGEDTYDYFIVASDTLDKYLIIKNWTDDAQCRDYIEALTADGDTKKIDWEWTGGSQQVDQQVKQMAVRSMSELTGQAITEDAFDSYFYPYCMDLTNMGDMDRVIWWMLLAFLLLLIGVIGWIVSNIRWHIKVAGLKNQDFYQRFEQSCQRSGEKIDTKNKALMVVPGFLLVPAYEKIVIALDQVVWCYVLPLAKKTYGLYIMDTAGKVVLLCRIKEKKNIYVREYLEQIHLAAPWMAIGYSEENRRAFSTFEKNRTIEKIIEEKNKIMSQFPL